MAHRTREIDACQARPTMEAMEPRLMLSVAVQNVLPGAPLRHLLDHLYDQIEAVIPDEFLEVAMPIIDLAMHSGRAGYSYLALPGEVNDVKIWGELGNTLLLTNESSDVTIFRLGTLSFDPIEEISFEPNIDVEGGGSFVGHIAGELGLQFDGIFTSLLKGWFDLSEPRVVSLNGATLLNLIPSANDLLNAFDSFLDFSLSNIVPSEITVIPPIRAFGKTIWKGWSIPMPSWLTNLPTVGDLTGWMVPQPVSDVFDMVDEVMEWLQSTFLTDGVYLSLLDGNDTADLSTLTGIPQTVHGGMGNDTFLAGGGQDWLDAAMGFPFRGAKPSREIEFFGDSGDDIFVVNRLYDSKKTLFDGGFGSDRLVIQGNDGNDIIRLIAGANGMLEEIRFEVINPLAGSPTNEIQQLTMPADVNGGTFRLKAEGWGWTADLPWNASAAVIEAALAHIANVADPTLGIDDIDVTGGAGTWEVEFLNGLAGKNFAALVADGAKLQRRVTAAVVSTDRDGGDGGGTPIANEIQRITLPDSVTGGTFTLQFDTYPATGEIPAGAGVGDLELALLRTGMPRQDFEITGGYGGPWSIEFTGTRALTDVPQIVVDASGLWAGLDNWDLIETQQGMEAMAQKQLVTLPDEANGGTFTLTFDDGRTRRTTDPLPYNATKTEVRDALAALGNVGGDENVDVEYGPSPWSWEVELIEDLAGTNYSLLEIDGSALTYSGAGIAVTTVADGLTVNERQIVGITPGNATGGTFSLSLSGQTTGGLAHNASAGNVRTALEGLTTVGAGNVLVTGPNGGPWNLEFVGTKAGSDMATVTVNAAGLTGPGTPYAGSVSVVTNGSRVYERQTVDAATTSTSPFVLTFMGQTTDPLAIDASAADVQAALEALSTIGAGNVQVTGPAGGPWTVEFVGAMAGTDQVPMSGKTVPGAAITRQGQAAQDEIQTLVVPNSVTDGHLQLIVYTPQGGASTVVEYDTDAQGLQDVLEDLSVVGAGNVEVTQVGSNPTTFEIAF
ncbi:MAG: hypothetical protein ACYS5V_08300, partial [Planctomycetota bacterium]